MPLMSRLFGRKPPAEPVAPPENTVPIDAQLATTLTAGGSTLEVAVNAALREYIEAKAQEATTTEAKSMPFWLRRDSERAGDIEDELRDRVIGRRSPDEGGS